MIRSVDEYRVYLATGKTFADHISEANRVVCGSGVGGQCPVVHAPDSRSKQTSAMLTEAEATWQVSTILNEDL